MDMKKSIKILALGVCAAMGFTMFAGCGSTGKSGGKVYLQAITGADAVGVVDADYYLLAEPAVTAQAKKGYEIAGDLQALYGGEHGYPQAVLVAKKDLVDSYPGWVASFAKDVAQSASWLEMAEGAEVVSAVSAHLADNDYATTLKASLLTTEVMGRCGVWFSSAKDSKAQVNAFLSEVLAVNGKATAMPTDAFFWEGAASGGAGPLEEVTVYMPDGAPAMALAEMMANDEADDEVVYKVVDPSLIASTVTNTDMSKNADMCVLPLTAASKVLGKGADYKMVGVVTHGNLFLISKDGEVVTADNMSVLKGKTIGVLKINEVPGLTLKVVLNKFGLEYEEIKTV